MTNIIVVGQRANELERNPKFGDLDYRFAMGGFKGGVSRQLLLDLGLVWTHAINLLPGLPTKLDSWLHEDRLEARDIALKLMRRYKYTDTLFVLMGQRVCQSFGKTWAPWTVEGQPLYGVKLMCMPHPSPRNRLWNDPEARERARAAIATLYGEVK